MPKKPTSVKVREKFDMQDIKELISILKRNNIWEFDLEQNGIRLHIVTGQSDKAQAREKMSGTNNVGQFPVSGYSPIVSVAASPPGGAAYPHPPAPSPPAPESKDSTSSQDLKAGEEKSDVSEAEKAEENLAIIQSPMVGTFYRAPAPDAPPYVDVNDEVKEGQVLCIIEAMKLMNELKCELNGKIVKVLVENGQPVEYGQHLFLIEPA